MGCMSGERLEAAEPHVEARGGGEEEMQVRYNRDAEEMQGRCR